MATNGAKFNAELHLKTRGFKTAGAAAERTGAQVERGTKRASASTERMRRTLSRLRTLVLTLGLATLGVQAGKLATEFDGSITKINTLVGVAREQVQGWRSDLLSLSGVVGRGPNELARALFVVTSAGEKGAAALRVVEQSAKASAAGLGDTATIARATTAAMQAYKDAGLTAAQATDVLVATVREGNLEASSLAGALGRVLGIAAEAGVSFGEVGGFVATFTRLGVNAEEAITALRGTLSLLFKSGKKGQEALDAVGLSLDGVRASVREKGLATTLVELVRAFEGNQDLLTQFVPNVRALSGVLGTAGAQAESFLAIEKAVVNSTGDLQKAFEGVADTPEQVFARMRASGEAALIAFGDGIARALSGSSVGIQQWLEENRDTVEKWGKQIGEVASVLADLLGLLFTGFEKLSGVVAALIAYKLAAWMITSAAATKGLMASNVSLKTSIWAVQSGYAKLWAMDVVGKMKAIALSTAGLTAAAVALGLGLNALVTDWKRRTDAERESIVESSKLTKAWNDVRLAIQSGKGVPTEVFSELRKQSVKASADLGRLNVRLGSYKKQLAESSETGGITHRVMGDFNARVGEGTKAIQAKIKATEAEIEEQRRLVTSTNEWMTRAQGLVTVTKEVTAATDDAANGAGDLADSSESVAEKIAKATEELLAEEEQLSALFSVMGEGKPFKLMEAAIARGIPVVALMNEEFAALLQKVVDYEEAIERGLPDIADLIHAGLEQRPDIKLPLIVDMEALNRSMAEWEEQDLPELVERAGKELDKLASEERARQLQAVYNNFLQGLQQEFASAFEGIFTKGLDSFEDLWQGVKTLAIKTLAQIAAAWAAQQFAINVTTGGGGTGALGGIVKSLFTSGGSAAAAGASGASGAAAGAGGTAGASGAAAGASGATTGALAALSTVAVIAAIYFLADAYADRQNRKRVKGTLEVGPDGSSVRSGLDGLREQLIEGNRAIQEVFRSLEIMTGGTLELMEQVQINVTGTGRIWVKMANGVAQEFEELGDAVEFAILQLARSAELTGAPEAVKQALKNTAAETVDQLVSDLQFAMQIAEIDMSPAERTFSSMYSNLQVMVDRAESLGIDTSPIFDQFGRDLESWRDQIVGIERSAIDERLAMVDDFNRVISDRRSFLRKQIEGLEVELSLQLELLGLQKSVLGKAVDAGLDAAGRFGAGILLAAGATEAGVARLEEQLAKLRRELDALPELIDPSEIRRGGGRGQKAAEREQLQQELEGILDSSITGFQATAKGIVEQIDRIRTESARLGIDADLATKAIAILGQQLRQDFGDAIRGDIHLSLTGFRDQLKGIQAKYEDLRAANEEHLATTGELIVARWKLNRAERTALEFLAGEALNSLGAGSDSLRRRYAAMAETVAFLNLMVAQGTLSAERLAATLAQLAQQELVAFGDALFGFLQRYYGEVEGHEAFRIQMERTRFELELANLKLQFQLMQDMGLLTAEVIAMAESAFAFVAANPIDWATYLSPPPAAVVAPPPPAPSPVFTAPAAAAAAGVAAGVSQQEQDMQRALDILKGYQDLALSPAQLELRRINEEFDFLRRVLGNTAEVQEAYRLALEDWQDRLLQGVKDFQEGLALGQFSNLSPRERLRVAEQQFMEMAQRALAGDIGAIEQLPQLAQAFLSEAQSFFGTGLGFQNVLQLVNAIFNQVQAAVASQLGLEPQPIGGGLGGYDPGRPRAEGEERADLTTGTPGEVAIAQAVQDGNDEIAALRADIQGLVSAISREADAREAEGRRIDRLASAMDVLIAKQAVGR